MSELLKYQLDPWSKAGLAERVRQANIPGIKVPPFYSAETAGKLVFGNRETVIARSEHPIEGIVNGPSGLFGSYVLTPDLVNWLQTQGREAQDIGTLLERICSLSGDYKSAAVYAGLSGIDTRSFYNELHHNYQQYVPGTNIAIVNEPDEGSWYFYACREKTTEAMGKRDYTYVAKCEQDGKIIPLANQLPEAEKWIEKAILSAANLRAVLCPEMKAIFELQGGDDGSLYFLQALRLAKDGLSGLRDSATIPENRLPAMFVRGNTGGRVLRVSGYLGASWEKKRFLGTYYNHSSFGKYGELIRGSAAAAIPISARNIREYASCILPVSIVPTEKEEIGNFFTRNEGHNLRSAVHKPAVTLVMDYDGLYEMLGDNHDIYHIGTQPPMRLEDQPMPYYAFTSNLVVWSNGNEGWVGVAD